MIEFFNTAILAVVEGLTEFIPVSSSGHLIVARELLGSTGTYDLSIDAVLQLATALALVVYFWRDILDLVYTVLYTITGRSTAASERALVVAVIVGTIPAVILGLLLESTMDTLFRSPILVAYALIVGSILFVVAEFVAQRLTHKRDMREVRWWDGLVVGLFQTLALVPGMSRSGMTIVGGMFLGFTRSEAARFGFILSIPILVGSGLKKLYELDTAGQLSVMGPELLLGAVLAFVTGLFAIALLMRIVRSTSLIFFAVYRVLLAALILVLF